MELVCQVSNKKDVATLTSVWRRNRKKLRAGDWVANRKWGAAIVSLIPPHKFNPKHDYALGNVNGEVMIFDNGVSRLFAGEDDGTDNT